LPRACGGIFAEAPKLSAALEHDPEKWMPVFRKDHAPMDI
jgi:hypothetical protein